MENPELLHLEVGQLAEMKSFEQGFRGAWFRCKIKEVFLKKNKVRLEYFDFPDEEISSTKIYEVPPYSRKSKHIKKHLMLRPHYPLMYRKNETPPVNSVSEVCVIVDGTWNVGDLVDWFKDDCYWFAMVIAVLSDDKVQLELPMSPVGEGGTHEAFCKDLRPSLDWSAEEGWRLATRDGQSSCSAQLIFPSQQDEVDLGMDYEEVENEATAGGEASSTSRISASNANANAIEEEGENRMMNLEEVKMEEEGKASSTSRISAANANAIAIEGDGENRMMNLEEVKMEEDGKAVCSSADSISTFHVEQSKQDVDVVGSEYISSNDKIELNMMHEETFEAAISDLEELANRVKWIKSILQDTSSSSSSTAASHWKFAD